MSAHPKGFFHGSVSAVLAWLPLSWFSFMAHGLWLGSFFVRPGGYWLGKSRRDIGLHVLGLAPGAVRAAESSRMLEVLLDWRMTAVRPDRRGWPGLDECAAALHKVVEETRQRYPGVPVIISPLHYVAQYVNIHVCDKLRQNMGLDTLAVVSAVPYGAYGDDKALVPHLKVFHTYDDGAKHKLGLQFFRALKRDGVAVLFADSSPYTLAPSPAETVGVTIFGRPGRIHRGVFRLGGPMHARLLAFYLRFDGRRFEATLYEPLDLGRPDAPQRVADLIEGSLRANYAQWLHAGHPAMYWFAAAK